MKRFPVLLVISALAMGCGDKTPPAAPATPTPAATPAPTEAPAGTTPPTAATTPKAAAPAAVPAAKTPAPAVAKPATPATPAALSRDEMKELERRPTATPPPADVKVAAGPKAKELAGAPGASPAAGPSDAPVKVFVFSDFQCPVCRRAAAPVKHLLTEFPNDVQVIFKHNALTSHARAEPAAKAAIAAANQGKFWEFHDKAFENNRNLADQDLRLYAEEVGCDMAKFDADVASTATAAQVAYERDLAQRVGARGTPGFFVNGKKTVGWGSYAGIRSQVSRALDHAKGLMAKGTARAEVAKVATAASGPDGQALAYFMWGMGDAPPAPAKP